MKLSARESNLEDEKQVDALAKFAPKVRKILRRYKEERKLSSIARQLGFHPSRLTEMITKNGKGQYKRRITPYYLAKFIDGGVMDVNQVLGRRKLEKLPVRARLFFERMILSRKTIGLAVEAQRRGIDVDRILETMLVEGNGETEKSPKSNVERQRSKVQGRRNQSARGKWPNSSDLRI